MAWWFRRNSPLRISLMELPFPQEIPPDRPHCTAPPTGDGGKKLTFLAFLMKCLATRVEEKGQHRDRLSEWCSIPA
jgi:hypothetical protein